MDSDSIMGEFVGWAKRIGARRLALLSLFVISMAVFAFVLFDPLLTHLGVQWLKGAQVHFNQGDYDECIRDCNRVIVRIGNWWEPFWLRAQAHLKKGDVQAAVDDLNRCTEVNPNIACVYALRGTLVGNPANAIKDFDHALSMNPEDLCSLKNRGVAKFRLRDYSGAAEDLQRFVELNKGAPAGFTPQRWEEVVLAAKSCLADSHRKAGQAGQPASRPAGVAASLPATMPTSQPATGTALLESGK